MKRSVFAKKKSVEKEIALERIKALFAEAETASQDLSNRYVYLARKISMKFKVRVPRELKRKFCKKCATYWRQGKNVRVRLSAGKMVFFCENCKTYMRLPYKGSRQSKQHKF